MSKKIIHIELIKLVILLHALILTPLTSNAQDMTLRCDGNSLESCYVYIEGKIQLNAGEKLQQLKIVDTNRVVLNSDGGDLLGGIFLGSVIRKLNLITEVGESTKRTGDVFSTSSNAGRCYSACAYAFLGGVERDSDSISRLGFHRFYNPIDFTDKRIGYAGELRSFASEEAQRVSAYIVMYLVEMGVDARMLLEFQDYGAESVYTFSRSKGLAYGIITNRKFGPWFIAPQGNSIFATTRRIGSNTPYDQIYQLTTYCKNQAGDRSPYILLSIPLQDYSDPEYMVSVGATMQFMWRGKKIVLEIDSSYIRSWKDSEYMQVEVAITDSVARVLSQVDKFDISMNTSRAKGLYYYYGQASKQERELIKASFIHCR